MLLVGLFLSTSVSAQEVATDTSMIIKKLTAHLQSSEISIIPDATKVESSKENTRIISMITKQSLVLLISVHASTDEATSQWRPLKEKLNGPDGNAGILIAQNKNLVVMIMPILEEHEELAKKTIDAFSKFDFK
jgi:hypothetical protein